MSRRRKRDDNEGLTEEETRWKSLDFYGSPPWSARAGAEVMKRLWPEAHTLAEPAAGMMSLAGPMADYFTVGASDIYQHVPDYPVIDFFDDDAWRTRWPGLAPGIIATNPPFVTAGEFLKVALTRARFGVALLVRTVWVESADRYPLFMGENPCTLIAFFSERVPMALGPWDPEVGSATSYSWMFWSKVHDPMPPIWFPPGTRDRLWRKDDPAKYGRLQPMPLFPDDFEVL
jgi:hypothetical protein